MNRPSLLSPLAVVVLSVFLSSLGCSSSSAGKTDETPPPDPIQANPGEPGPGTSGGTGTSTGAPAPGPEVVLPSPVVPPSPPPCRIDDDCAGRAGGLRCEASTGECVAARRCSEDANCSDTLEGAEYCQGVGCRCVRDAEEGQGVCRRRRAVCEECTDDSQCGSGPTFEPRGACKALPGDTSGKRYCFRLQEGPTCECGYVDDGAGFCKPASNQCTGTGCGADSDCGSGEACNVATCLCEDQCRWDFQKQKEVPGCPDGQTCWVDQANLNPTSKSYGMGRCRPPCTGDGQCTDASSNPYGGPDLVCETEKVGASDESPARCRPTGECMDDRECPQKPLGSAEKGYCDRDTRTCKSDCRLGTDPLTGLPFQDCREGYGCQNRDGVNTCVEKSCSELGGQHLACSQPFDLCCGVDFDADGSTAEEVASCAGSADKKGCFAAPAETFCQTCTQPADCQGLSGPANSPLANLCVAFADPVSMSTVGICSIAAKDDFTRDPNGVLKASLGCPKGFSVTRIPVNLNPDYGKDEDFDLCKTDAECSAGHTKGVCGVDPATQRPDGTGPRACLCNDEGSMLCPNDPNSQLTSVCRAGTGVRSCFRSVVCVADPALIFGTETTPGCLSF